MDISSICISNVFVSGFGPEFVHPEINIVKSLPVLSVVQSLHGNYRIGLESSVPVDIPEGCVFVLGDNRQEAADSRDFGPVSLESVEGKVISILRRRGL